MKLLQAVAATAIVALGGGALAAITSPGSVQAASAGTVVSVTSTSLGGDRLTARPNLSFSASSAVPDIRVDSSRQFQAIDGFGATFNEAGWNTLNQSTVSASQRASVMSSLFNSQTGAGFTLTRTPMGSDDFAMSRYTYDDTSGNAADPSLSNFSISHDLDTTSGLIPYIKAAQDAQAANDPKLRIMASPWTAPAWMKNNQSLYGTATSSGDSSVTPSNYDAYASYFAKYVAAYKQQGIDITDVSVQNEPENAAKFEATLWNSDQMASFVGNNLGPTFASQGTGARIRVYEHNQDHWYYPANVLNDTKVKQYAAGANFHPYECDFSGSQPSYCLDANLDLFNQAAPGYSTWMSEHTDLGQAEPSNYIRDERWSREIVKQMLHGEGGYIYWNMVLNQNGGPVEHPSAPQEPLVEVDTSTSPATVSYMPKYYGLAQFSKFVRPGAHRIGAEGGITGDDVVQTAFENPDGSRALVVVNSGPARSVTVGEDGSAFTAALQAHSTTTFTWAGAVDSYSIDTGSTSTSTYSWTDVAGEHFTPDSSVSGGSVSSLPASTDVANTADDSLYRTTRRGVFSYTLPVPNGRYKVTLLLSDNTSTAAGQNTFSVTAEGTSRWGTLDPYAAAGGKTAYSPAPAYVNVTDGKLNIATVAQTGTPSIAGIRVSPTPSLGFQHASKLSGGTPTGYTTDTGVLPGTIFAQDYNDGGAGQGYTIANPIASNTGYRSDETNLVTTSDTTYGGGQNITGLTAGDKLNYTVDVVAGGNYDVVSRVKSTTGTGQYQLQLDGVNLGPVITISNSSGAWTASADSGLTIPAGVHTLTVKVITAGFDLRYLTVPRVNNLTTTQNIEAENYGPGGEGVGYHDTDAGNSNTTYGTGDNKVQLRGYYRGGDVDLEQSSMINSQLDNYDVGNTADGEWLRYDVYSPATASYDISTRVASNYTSGRFQYAIDTPDAAHAAQNPDKNNSPEILNVPDTNGNDDSNGFQSWMSETQRVTIPAGTHRLYLLVVQGGFNIDRLIVSKAGEGWAKTVGFGSSSAAGPGINPSMTVNQRGLVKSGYLASGPTCGRSMYNQVNYLAYRQGIRDQFYDASCNGDVSGSIANATSSDGSTSSIGDQLAEASAGYKGNPGPGSGALGTGTTTVTVAIGANDAYGSGGTYRSSIFQAIDACGATTSCVDSSGTPIVTVKNGSTLLARPDDITEAAMMKNLRPIVQQIKLLAPNARIRFIGYHAALGDGSAGCQDPSSPAQWSYTPQESSYLHDLIAKHVAVEDSVITNLRTVESLTTNQLQFVDIQSDTVDHGLCAPLNQRWNSHPQNGKSTQTLGTTYATPVPDQESSAALHPNESMHAVEARDVASTLQ